MQPRRLRLLLRMLLLRHRMLLKRLLLLLRMLLKRLLLRCLQLLQSNFLEKNAEFVWLFQINSVPLHSLKRNNSF